MKASTNTKRRPRNFVSSSVLGEKELAQNIAKTESYLKATQDQFLARLAESSIYFQKNKEAGLLAGSIARR
jgi:hypothetical protein